ncbi:hypothetical protein V496_06454 [Pseudogymnoascus sp. VKM F-4515 (FW-2607)]|nr:hypothetical protein V496_06454 [Pseudogymnoascus sp. VKM F-4515 (FW-2607)]
MVQIDDITILHFNDVYHISDAAHVARFASVFADPRHVTGEASVPEHQLRIFSGDAFSPSLEASVLRGEHMPALLNALNIDVACYGNHDFDFGEARLIDLSERTTFPWTLANAVRKQPIGQHDSKLLARAHEHVIRDIAGYKIGFLGLAGTDWPSNCQHLPSCDILDPVDIAQGTARRLRQQENCDLVIALTHMRLTEDIAVAHATRSGEGWINLLLGGHDHNVVQRASTDDEINPDVAQQGVPPTDAAATDYQGDVRIIKSGTDWRGLSIIRLSVARLPDNSVSILNVKLKQIADLTKMSNYNDIPPCPNTLRIISDVHAKIEKLVEAPLLMTDIALEGRSQIVRSQEANLGNMLADAVRAYYNTDIAFVNSGAIRCDRIIQAQPNQPLRIRDVIDISPFDNAFVVKRVSGRVLVDAFENSVSDAHTDGRFLQVSGVRIVADWDRLEGRRIGSVAYVPRDGPPQAIGAERMYTVAMVDFIASGFDGYRCFQDTETLVDAEGAMTDTNLLLQVFGAAPAEDNGGVGGADRSTVGIQRAKESIILGRHSVNQLPVIRPRIEGRIRFVNSSPSL